MGEPLANAFYVWDLSHRDSEIGVLAAANLSEHHLPHFQSFQPSSVRMTGIKIDGSISKPLPFEPAGDLSSVSPGESGNRFSFFFSSFF